MAVCMLRSFSQALQKQCESWIVLPDEPGDAPLPVLYLLHGLSDDASVWMRRSSIERHAAEHRLMVVMPDGGRGFYSDAVHGYAAYEQHILELIAVIEQRFRARAERDGRAIGGLSMGGYGAIKLALKHRELFCSAHSHSGALDIEALHRERPELRLIYGDAVAGSENPMRLAERPGAVPRLRIDCGVDDHLIAHNRGFHAHLEELGIAHDYQEFPGAHDWAYWDAHVPQALRFHVQGAGW